ncbi:hypothetical protein [Catellatospora sichuanensis]|uniref:hypothetical protein n=1 Tax=Catellatospora sichuanensis TaxID=1969805 RepID=UPI0011834B2D|nr:hypothetical protein [Catellatospora sichuanensis]
MDTYTVTYVAMGMTDDVTTCEICGKPELKGTVRLMLVDSDGNSEGEVFAGVSCAAKRAGRKATEIRTEAKRADKARENAVREAHSAWRSAHSEWTCKVRDAHFGPVLPRPMVVCEYYSTPEFKAANAAWIAANPEPPRPHGW